jgi:hypothetical protein
MDHNNSSEGKCSCGADKKNCANCQTYKDKKGKGDGSEKKYCTCPHGKCKDHDPEWETISAVSKPNPGIFGAKTYWFFHRCCEKGMTRIKKMVWQRCRKCGRERKIETAEFALCMCCGNHHQIFYRSPESKIVFPAKTGMPKYSPENYSGD